MNFLLIIPIQKNQIILMLCCKFANNYSAKYFLPVLLFVVIFHLLKCEQIPIDLAVQHGTQNRHGNGDVVQLWEENLRNPKMRNALRNNAPNRWTTERDGTDAKFVIPYRISGNFTQTELKVIFEAMEKIERNTCIKFRTKRENSRRHKDFVDIQNEYGEGCYTSVGRSLGRNVLMLESTVEETCITSTTVLHELFHKLGLWHEHMRADRDKFIRVHFSNIPFYLHAQFRTVAKNKAITYGVRYDYRSLMQYGENAFARPADALSIETRKRKFQKVIGTAEDASRGDWIKICAIYNCTECMRSKFDLANEAEEYGREEEQQGDEEEEEEEEEEDDCMPLPGCGTTITRERHSLWKIACCEPCAECRPDPLICEWPQVRTMPRVYNYDCCGRCDKRRKKDETAK